MSEQKHDTDYWLSQLIQRRIRETDPALVEAIHALTLPEHHDAIPQLVQLLNNREVVVVTMTTPYDDHLTVGRVAADVLEKIGQPAISALIDAIRQQPNQYHDLALKMLKTYPMPAALPILSEHYHQMMLQDYEGGDEPDYTRDEAINSNSRYRVRLRQLMLSWQPESSELQAFFADMDRQEKRLESRSRLLKRIVIGGVMIIFFPFVLLLVVLLLIMRLIMFLTSLYWKFKAR